MTRLLAFAILLSAALPATARIGLVTVPGRDAVQLTIYNSADLTLARERRTLTMAKGVNRLEFSWAGTQIDPTSVQFDAVTRKDAVEIVDISFPADAPNALVWTIESEVDGEVVVEISYFTAGLGWSADYEARVNEAETEMSLSSFVKVSNRSGEEYDGAQVRLVVGTINLVEEITDLANRGARSLSSRVQYEARAKMMSMDEAVPSPSASLGGDGVYLFAAEAAPPEIVREGLSEYFIYTVGGVHAVPDAWAVRWLNFSVAGVPVENFYRFEEGRYDSPRRFVRLQNAKSHKLGEEPLPDGEIHVYQNNGAHRVYLGGSLAKYVPVGEKWEIDLGEDPDVLVKPVNKKMETLNFEFNNKGNVSGWDAREEWELELINSRSSAVTIEADRNFTGDFELTGVSEKDRYDYDTARFRRTLSARSRQMIKYGVIYRFHSRAKR